MQEVNVKVTDRGGKQHELVGLDGWRLMEVIRDNELPIKAECGGACSCATCHVYVASEWLDKLAPVSGEEEEMLDEAFEVEDNSRLSCQIILSDALEGLEVTLAPEMD
ncbi:MAG: 2Fe-2S iron-sulfur cluster-binding protein [Rickettsiales bacterium]|nr:2Fe-2S iron-sulfur cluster-binding protein [Rickettsiales bacterium]